MTHTTLATGALALALAAPAALADTHMSGPAYEAAQDFAGQLQDGVQTAFEGGDYTSLAS